MYAGRRAAHLEDPQHVLHGADQLRQVAGGTRDAIVVPPARPHLRQVLPAA